MFPQLAQIIFSALSPFLGSLFRPSTYALGQKAKSVEEEGRQQIKTMIDIFSQMISGNPFLSMIASGVPPEFVARLMDQFLSRLDEEAGGISRLDLALFSREDPLFRLFFGDRSSIITERS